MRESFDSWEGKRYVAISSQMSGTSGSMSLFRGRVRGAELALERLDSEDIKRCVDELLVGEGTKTVVVRD